jgi:uncharacterized protein (UPF0262 family)
LHKLAQISCVLFVINKFIFCNFGTNQLRMSTISSIEMYNILKGKLGENEAQALTEYVESKVEKSLDKEKDVLATKVDLAEAKSEIIKWMFIFWIGQIAVTLALVYFKS